MLLRKGGYFMLYGLIQDLVAFKTVYPNVKAFEDIIKYIKEYFKDSGLIIEEYDNRGEISLIISNTKEKKFDIIFAGHLDVVMADESMFTVKKQGDNILGRGVADMKGQVAAMMYAIKNMKTSKKVALILTCDEERGGKNGAGFLIKNNIFTGNIVVVPDGGGNFDLVIEEKGVVQLELTINGQAAHGSRPWLGVNAIEKAFSTYEMILKKFPLPTDSNDWKTSVNLSNIKCENVTNKVPDVAQMILDIRFVQDNSKEEIIEYISNLEEVQELKILGSINGTTINFNNKEVDRYLEICERILGRPINQTRACGSSDVKHFASKNIDFIMMNPECGGLHAPSEWANYDSLITLAKIYQEFIK
jgi:succinyl-diaminopimelate desuccinylase